MVDNAWHQTSRWSMTKDEVVANAGMVSAGHRLAAEVGVEMLRRGGNAIDAAVAAAWAVGVVEPWMSGAGGVGAMVVLHHGHRMVVDFGLRAPLAARPDMYTLLPERASQGQYGWPAVKDEENQIGHRSVGVPGVVAGLCLAHERLGTLPREAVMEPAVALAADGFDVDWYTSLILGLDLGVIARFPRAAAIFLSGGAVPPRPSVLLSVPDRIVQRDLAETLRRIAKLGPDVFYRGEIAKALGADMRANGGVLLEEDLAAYQPRVHDNGLRGSYRGIEIVGVPGPTGAPIVQGILNILEGYDLGRFGVASVVGLHLITEACRRAYEDFFEHVGDPEQVTVPWEGLLSKAYAAAVRETISMDRASATRAVVDPWRFQAPEGERSTDRSPGVSASRASRHSPHTTHVCAVDRERNAVSVTLTLGNLLGSHVVVPGTGVVLNDMMLLFDPRPGFANSIACGKWQATPVAPTLLLDHGKLRAAIGTPGGRRIPTAIAQVIVNLMDRGLGMQAAIAAPRLHAEGPEILLDDRFGPTVFDGLHALGHRVITAEKTPCSFNFAQPNGIAVGADEDLRGGVDPFTPAAAVGLVS
jgi:gamma-glutamyltranspeptidase / glutathione hydrolase